MHGCTFALIADTNRPGQLDGHTAQAQDASGRPSCVAGAAAPGGRGGGRGPAGWGGGGGFGTLLYACLFSQGGLLPLTQVHLSECKRPSADIPTPKSCPLLPHPKSLGKWRVWDQAAHQQSMVMQQACGVLQGLR